tara:strand:+ start:20 stop:664 length:645 start_codon:yes stop_codon:yes gene_type:complete
MIPFWYDKISILYDKNYIFDIVPFPKYDLNRKLNAILRLAIYYSFAVYLLDNTKTYVFSYILGAIIFTYVIYFKYKESTKNKILNNVMNGSEKEVEELKGECRIPTKDNPFMNPLLADFGTNNTKPSCASYNNKGVKMTVENNFEEDLYKDVNDIFGKNNSQRQYYTMPGNSVPNDRDTFMKWCYQTPPTCKEGNGLQCAANQLGEHRGTGRKN